MQKKEYARLVFPGNFELECLRDEWGMELHQQASQVLKFWDTFEWGLWFGGNLLYSCENKYHLCANERGWIGAQVCEEQAVSNRRFWGDFETPAMRAISS